MRETKVLHCGPDSFGAVAFGVSKAQGPHDAGGGRGDVGGRHPTDVEHAQPDLGRGNSEVSCD